MMREKWSDLKPGLMTLLTRNAIVTILYNIAYQYSTLMKNAARPLVVTVSCAQPVAYVSLLTSLFSFVSLLCNMPVGAIIDRNRDWMKRIMVAANIFRAALYFFGFGMVTTRGALIVLYILDGIVFCFLTIMGPALLSISVDKKAMGSAFAVYSGLTTICVSSSKSLAQSLFRNVSCRTSFTVSAAIALLSAIILLFLDGDKVLDSMKKEIRC